MNLFEEQSKFAADVAKLINFILSKEYFVTLGEAFRPQEMADIYVKEHKGIHDSLHCKRLAIDLNIFDHQGNFLTRADEYKTFGEYFESLDPINRWGGFFVSKYGGKLIDCDHFERNFKN